MKPYYKVTLSILSGLLFVCAWPMSPLTFLIFVAWLPLLVIADNEPNKNRFWLYAFLAMLVWNGGTTWWIWNATAPGAIGAIVINAMFMCVPLLGYHSFKNRYGSRIGCTSFIVFWLTFEYIHLNWQLSWPWLTLGNCFASNPEWVQWYEYTGTSGGSLWVMLLNILIFIFIKKWQDKDRKLKIQLGITIALTLIIPISVSYLMYRKPGNTAVANSPNVIIVQPNVDPYNEKFAEGGVEAQIQKLISLSEVNIDTDTRLILWPETALPVAVWQGQLQQNVNYKPVLDFAARHPNITIQTGIETLKNYGTEKATITARKNESDGTYYDAFNAAVIIGANQPFKFYNKSKLVPGVETLPDFLMWMGAIFEKFGGTTGGYGRDKESAVFKTPTSPYITAPIICYESIYGDYIATYVNKGANLLTIMTNDGWWANTPGHRQHLNYARLRAIETRKWVARSANTGISAVIDQYGNLVETRQWAVAGTIKFSIPPLTGETFFVRNGDIISKLTLLLFGILFIYNIVTLIKRKVQTPEGQCHLDK